MSPNINNAPHEDSSNFIEDMVKEDLRSQKYLTIQTRFPPEPNGYLHIGHAKSICLNFGLAQKYGGKVNLRFDDTNPATEDENFVESIQKDVQWLGFQWDKLTYASDYFEHLFQFAKQLIQKGVAYVDDHPLEVIQEERGVPSQPGKESVFRQRTIAENLKLFQEMYEGKYKDGERVLRARIDMSSPNMHFRDPILYRIRHEHHYRTGDQWCIYPTYDFAHGQCDALEEVTHSICTLEFSPHRPLYDWFIEQLGIFPSQQYEFARLNLTYCVLSKRKLMKLVQEKKVDGWDDPRMPTISGMKNRGYTPEALREFCHRVGVQKRDSLIDYSLLEFCVRDHLNQIALRRMVVFDPIKVVLTNFEGEVEYLDAENNPENPADGHRRLALTKEIYIEREDFMETPPSAKYFRLAPGSLVRLKHAYIIQCDDMVRDERGKIKEIHCSIIPHSKSGADTSGVKVKGTLHWVSATLATSIHIHLYDRLFSIENPAQEGDCFLDYVHPDSHRVVPNAIAELTLEEDQKRGHSHFQFLRKGYFYLTTKKDAPVFHQSVSLKDTWTKTSKS